MLKLLGLYDKAESSQERKLYKYLRWLAFPRRVRQQYPVGPYTLDMALPGKKIDVEVDGRYFHRMDDRPKRDAARDSYMERQGWTVVRFTELEVDLSPFTAALHVIGIMKAL